MTEVQGSQLTSQITDLINKVNDSAISLMWWQEALLIVGLCMLFFGIVAVMRQK